MKKKWSAGKKTAVIIGSICAGILLFTVFCLDVFRLAWFFFGIENNDYPPVLFGQKEYENWEDSSGGSRGGPGSDSADDFWEDYEDGSGEESSGGSFYGSDDYGGEQGSSEYYEFHDAIRGDLSYQVDFEYCGETFGTDNVELSMSYPVVYGRDASIDLTGVNNAVQKEMKEVKEYVSSVGGQITDDIYFRFEVDSYVTYMDEDILSVIYVESGYLDGENYGNYVISVNVDMESGLVMTNSQILDIDDEFSVDFRNRSEKQNGEVAGISMFSDQDITEMLTDDDSLIIFYTPLGMEVGFNYYYGWVTVTYRDYQKYKGHF